MNENVLIVYTKWLVKWLLIIFVGIAALILAIFLSTTAYKWWTHDRFRNSISLKVSSNNSDPLFIRDPIPESQSTVEYEQLLSALVKADYAGDTVKAKRLAERIKALKKRVPWINIKKRRPDGSLAPCLIFSERIQVAKVTITNNSSRPITRVSVRVSMFLPNRSTDISSYSNNVLTSDWVIEPGASHTICKAVDASGDFTDHRLLGRVSFSGKLWNVEFK